MRETQKVDIIQLKDQFQYTEKEILEAWNSVGRQHNGLTFAWLVEKLRANKEQKNGNE